LVLTINLKLGAIAALVLVLLDPVETSRELTIYGAGLGQGQMTIASRLVFHVWQSSTYLFTFVSVMAWIAVTFAIGFLVFRHQDAA
jgi:hypothetical protein